MAGGRGKLFYLRVLRLFSHFFQETTMPAEPCRERTSQKERVNVWFSLSRTNLDGYHGHSLCYLGMGRVCRHTMSDTVQQE